MDRVLVQATWPHRVETAANRERELRQRVSQAEQALAWAKKDLEDFLQLRREIAESEQGTKEAAGV